MKKLPKAMPRRALDQNTFEALKIPSLVEDFARSNGSDSGQCVEGTSADVRVRIYSPGGRLRRQIPYKRCGDANLYNLEVFQNCDSEKESRGLKDDPPDRGCGGNGHRGRFDSDTRPSKPEPASATGLSSYFCRQFSLARTYTRFAL
ncbi:MAG: hypothetical protein IH914_07795 [candidate division Zixibacteria bacterium]|nr:hypothetical protein [candidate division Zixibacteria bacterium]